MKSRDYEKIDWLNFVELEKSSPSGLVWKHNRKQAGSRNYKKNGKPLRIF